jgi:hypothetical protein
VDLSFISLLKAPAQTQFTCVMLPPLEPMQRQFHSCAVLGELFPHIHGLL